MSVLPRITGVDFNNRNAAGFVHLSSTSVRDQLLALPFSGSSGLVGTVVWLVDVLGQFEVIACLHPGAPLRSLHPLDRVPMVGECEWVTYRKLPTATAPCMVDPRELRDKGYLLEANRHFFHRYGMALSYTAFAGGDDVVLTGVEDHRELPGGYSYSPPVTQVQADRRLQQIAFVAGEGAKRIATRIDELGAEVQTLEEMTKVVELEVTIR